MAGVVANRALCECAPGIWAWPPAGFQRRALEALCAGCATWWWARPPQAEARAIAAWRTGRVSAVARWCGRTVRRRGGDERYVGRCAAVCANALSLAYQTPCRWSSPALCSYCVAREGQHTRCRGPQHVWLARRLCSACLCQQRALVSSIVVWWSACALGAGTSHLRATIVSVRRLAPAECLPRGTIGVWQPVRCPMRTCAHCARRLCPRPLHDLCVIRLRIDSSGCPRGSLASAIRVTVAVLHPGATCFRWDGRGWQRGCCGATCIVLAVFVLYCMYV